MRHDAEQRRYVYIVQGEKTGLLKIGLASNVRRRLLMMQSTSPDILRVIKVLGPISGAHQIEQAFHWAFAEHRKHGEWFAPDEEILNAVDSWSDVPPTHGGRKWA
jgi:hypothetical protein